MSASETKQHIPEDACSEARRAQRRRDRKFDRRSNWRPALNLTSMIDVVFLLLVYFMVATEFKRAEVIERLDLPNRLGAGVADPFEVPDHPVIITVFPKTRILDARRWRPDSPLGLKVHSLSRPPSSRSPIFCLNAEWGDWGTRALA